MDLNFAFLFLMLLVPNFLVPYLVDTQDGEIKILIVMVCLVLVSCIRLDAEFNSFSDDNLCSQVACMV